MSMKFKFIKRGMKLGYVGGAVAGGALLGSTRAEPGLRKQGAAEGAAVGAALGLGTIFAGKIAKIGLRGTQAVLKESYVFRRIRGRIVRIKVKRL